MRTSFTDDDEGKPVVGAEGESVGIVEEVRAGTAYVDPDPGLVARITSRLGWGQADEEQDYTLGAENVSRVTDDEVELSVQECGGAIGAVGTPRPRRSRRRSRDRAASGRRSGV